MSVATDGIRRGPNESGRAYGAIDQKIKKQESQNKILEHMWVSNHECG